MKYEKCRLFIRIIVCIPIMYARSTKIIEPILNVKSSFLSNIIIPGDPGQMWIFGLGEDRTKSDDLLKIEQEFKSSHNSDDFYNKNLNDQGNLIVSQENWEEVPQLEATIEKQKDFSGFEQLEDVSENENTSFDEVEEDHMNLKPTTKPTYKQYVRTEELEDLQGNFNVADDASRMILMVGSLEDTVEDAVDDVPIRKSDTGERRMFSKNKNGKNKTDFNRILSAINRKLKKVVFSASKNESAFLNRIEVNVGVDASEMKDIVQALRLTKTKEKVVNPHLGEKKSFYKYEQISKKASEIPLHRASPENPLDKIMKTRRFRLNE